MVLFWYFRCIDYRLKNYGQKNSRFFQSPAINTIQNSNLKAFGLRSIDVFGQPVIPGLGFFKDWVLEQRTSPIYLHNFCDGTLCCTRKACI